VDGGEGCHPLLAEGLLSERGVIAAVVTEADDARRALSDRGVPGAGTVMIGPAAMLSALLLREVNSGGGGATTAVAARVVATVAMLGTELVG